MKLPASEANEHRRAGGAGRRSPGALLALAILLASGPRLAAATPCGSAASLWQYPLPVTTGFASAPSSDTSFGAGYTYLVQGNTLHAIRNTDGTKRWDPVAFPDNIQNFPIPVPLSSGGEAVFLAAGDGYLYKVDVSDGSYVGLDVRRASCPYDTLIATPTVQIWNYSDQSFRDAFAAACQARGLANCPPDFPDDLVFVITRFMCGTNTRNQVNAYRASDLARVWTFNETGAYAMDFGSEGCGLDYGRDRLYCGTDLPEGRYQNTLWAINTGDGSLAWATNVGAIRNRPQLRTNRSDSSLDRLYVATYDGSLRALDPNTDPSDPNFQNWVTTVTNTGTGVVRNPWPEFRNNFGSLIFVTDGDGVLHAFQDTGSAAVNLWAVGSGQLGARVMTMPAVEPALGQLFVGADDGRVYQLDLATGTSEASAQVGDPAALVFDPSLDYDGSDERLVLANDGNVRRYCIPWPLGDYGTSNARFSSGGCLGDADCPSTDCSAGNCDVATGTCYSWARPDGTACSDKIDCTCDSSNLTDDGNCPPQNVGDKWDTCHGGVCVGGTLDGSFPGGCGCPAVGDRGCGGSTCCPGAGCVDTDNDPSNCGACGHACDPGRNCNNGVCRRQQSSCQSPSEINFYFVAAQKTDEGVDTIDGASGVAFDEVCNAYVSSYLTTASNSLVLVPARASRSDATTPFAAGGDFRPLDGVTVSPDGAYVFGALVNERAPLDSPVFGPGLMVVNVGAATVEEITTGAAATAGPGTLFADARWDYGPVGPAFDRTQYDSGSPDTATLQVYLANWHDDGDIYLLERRCNPGCSWTATAAAPPGPAIGERISSLAFGVRQPSGEPTLYAAHGNGVLVWGLAHDTREDVTLATAWAPSRAGQAAATGGILSLSADTLYGDCYVEARDAGGANGVVLLLRADDLSVSYLGDVANDLRLAYSSPPGYVDFVTTYPDEGRLAATGETFVLRSVPLVDDIQVYDVSYNQIWRSLPLVP